MRWIKKPWATKCFQRQGFVRACNGYTSPPQEKKWLVGGFSWTYVWWFLKVMSLMVQTIHVFFRPCELANSQETWCCWDPQQLQVGHFTIESSGSMPLSQVHLLIYLGRRCQVFHIIWDFSMAFLCFSQLYYCYMILIDAVDVPVEYSQVASCGQPGAAWDPGRWSRLQKHILSSMEAPFESCAFERWWNESKM